MKKFILCAVVALSTCSLYAQEKIFVREYTYAAGETDSRVTARQKAIEQVKVMLLEELGTYVESYVNYNVKESNKIHEEFFQKEIKTISVGITETKILEEKWNGEEFYVKAQIKADPNEVIRKINQTLSARRSSAVIDSLRLLLNSSNQEIYSRNSELEKVKSQLATQNRELQTRQASLSSLNQQLEIAKQKLSTYQAQENQIVSEIEKIEQKINAATRTALDKARIGMTPTEVIQVCGQPRSKDNCSSGLYYNYGNVWVIFTSGILTSVVSARLFERCYGADWYQKKNLLK
jgi:chromosome segregation ATPase